MSKPFITDLGEPVELKSGDAVLVLLPRYGVWAYDPSKGKHQVVDIGSDLNALAERHGIPATVTPVREGRPIAPP